MDFSHLIRLDGRGRRVGLDPGLGFKWILVCTVFVGSCSSRTELEDTAYVVPEQLKLKSSTAQAARYVGELKSGDRVTITSRSSGEDGTPWASVAGPGGESGWAEAKNFVKQEIVDKSRQIADEIKEIQTQAVGKSKASLKLRLTPDRTDDGNVATMLPSGVILEIVARERKPKPPSLEANDPPKSGKEQSGTRYDEWYKVRLKDYAVLPAGWIYGGSVELEIPAEILYFGSSGRRIIGWQKIADIPGNDSKSGEHYLAIERKIFGADDQVDFDRVKVLAYDPASRNYTTPFREDVSGRFPITLKMQGTKGTFQFDALDKNRQAQSLTYSLEMLDGGKVKVTKPAKK